MKKKNLFKGLLGLATITLALTSCGGSSSKKSKEEDSKEKTSEIESQSIETGSKTVDPNVPHESLIESSNESKESSNDSIESSSSEEIVECDHLFKKGITFYDVITPYTCDNCGETYYGVDDTDLYFNYDLVEPTLTTEGSLTIILYSFDGETFTPINVKKTIDLPELTSDFYIVEEQGNKTYYSVDYTTIETAVKSIIKVSGVDSVISSVEDWLTFYTIKDQYTVTIDLGSKKLEFKSDEDGEVLFDASAFPNAIAGFSETKGATTVEYDFGTWYAFDGDTTLYPVYKPTTPEIYKVTIHVDDETIVIKADEYGGVILDSTDLPEDVIGFSESSSSSEVDYNVGAAITLDSDLELYALFDEGPVGYNYIVTIDLGYDSIDLEADNDGYVTLSLEYSTGILGFTSDPSSDVVEYELDETIQIDDDITLYAIYDESDNFTLTIYLGDDFITVKADEFGFVDLYLEDSTNILGFTSTKGSTEVEYEVGELMCIEEDTTIYAIYDESDSITLTIYLGDDFITVEADEDGFVNAYVEDSTNILGFTSTKGSTEVEYEVNEVMSIEEDTTIYAIYETTNKVTLYFDKYVGTYYQATVGTNSYFEILTQYGTTKFARDRQELLYFVDEEDNEYDIFDMIQVTEDINLYGVWEYKEITISYVNNNSPFDFELDDTYAYYGSTFEVSNCYFDDIYLSGWTTQYYDYYETPEVKPMFVPGLSYNTDDYTYTYQELVLYPCFSEYTYTVSRIEPTLDYDGRIIYTCNEDDSKSYYEMISRYNEFYFYVEDSFSITDRGIVLTGKVLQGKLNMGDKISIITKNGVVINDIEVLGLEMFRKVVETTVAGDNVGILIGTDYTKDQFPRGSLVTANYKSQSTSTLYAEMYVLTAEEGGRSAAITPGTYRPQLYAGVSDMTVNVTKAWDLDYKEVNQMLPGNKYIVEINCLENNTMLTIKDQYLAIREGGKTICYGTVILNDAAGINDISQNLTKISFYAAHPQSGSYLFPYTTTSSSTTYVAEKAFYIDSNLKVKDIILEVNSVNIQQNTSKAKETFRYITYPLRGYYTSLNIDDEAAFEAFQETYVRDLPEGTKLYLIWPEETYQ